jgi:hypothetical protein
VGIEPWIFCSVGGRDDHYAKPPELGKLFFFAKKFPPTIPENCPNSAPDTQYI